MTTTLVHLDGGGFAVLSVPGYASLGRVLRHPFGGWDAYDPDGGFMGEYPTPEAATAAVATRPLWFHQGLPMRRFLALCLALALAPPALGQLKFDPTGNFGSDPNVTLNLTALTTNGGALLAQGGGNPAVDKPVVVRFQCQVGSLNTQDGPSALFGGPTQGVFLRTAAGFVDTGRQLVLTAIFRAKVASVSNGGATVTLAPDLTAGPNLVSLYSQSAADPNSASYNDPNGVGYDPQPCPADKILILQGNVNVKSFMSSFTADKASLAAPVPLNQHGWPRSSYAGVRTATGRGNTRLSVDVTFADPRFWPRVDPAQLPFKTLLLQAPGFAPVTGCEPPVRLFDGTVPDLGPVNGAGADWLMECGPCVLAPAPGG